MKRNLSNLNPGHLGPWRRMCTVCRERQAVLPDRNRAPSMIRRICRECHADRLQGDIQHALNELAKPPREKESE